MAERATDVELRDLQTLHLALEGALESREKFFEINERFHMRLLELADNKWRNQMVADLRKVMKLNRHNSLFKSGRVQESLAEHRELVQAIMQRDKALAVDCMKKHFQTGLDAAI